MKIDFRDLRVDENQHMELKESVAFPGFAEKYAQVVSLSPVEATAGAVLDKRVCHVDGTLDYTVNYVCSRCLEPFDHKQRTRLSEDFTDDEGHVNDETHYAEGGAVDVNPYIEESIQLDLEFFPICQEDCKGLCPVCGINRNEATCSCNMERTDPRLEALRGLLSDADSE